MVGGARIELHLYLAYGASQFTRTVPSNVAGKMGFEPITFRLTAERSTIELHANIKKESLFVSRETARWLSNPSQFSKRSIELNARLHFSSLYNDTSKCRCWVPSRLLKHYSSIISQPFSVVNTFCKSSWRVRWDSNPRPLPWQGNALTNWATHALVGNTGFEPMTSRVSGGCSTNWANSLWWAKRDLNPHLVRD